MPRLFNIDCATLPQQVALNRDNIKQLAEWLTNNPDIGNISVTTLAPGSQATATITRRYDEETDKAYIDVTLGIPQGATGATGATGPEGPKGDKGDPGSDLFTDFTSVKIDTSAAHVAYSDGTAHITDATLIGYKSTGNEEVECAVDIPIVAGSGVTVDANDANNAIEVSATGGGGGKYVHVIEISLFDSDHYTFQFISNRATAYTTSPEDYQQLWTDLKAYGTVSCAGGNNSGNVAYKVSATGEEGACELTFSLQKILTTSGTSTTKTISLATTTGVTNKDLNVIPL